jgi:hypothetical protein
VSLRHAIRFFGHAQQRRRVFLCSTHSTSERWRVRGRKIESRPLPIVIFYIRSKRAQLCVEIFSLHLIESTDMRISVNELSPQCVAEEVSDSEFCLFKTAFLTAIAFSCHEPGFEIGRSLWSTSMTAGLAPARVFSC